MLKYVSWLPENRWKPLTAKALISHFLCKYCDFFIYFYAKSRICLEKRKYFSLTVNPKITALAQIKETV